MKRSISIAVFALAACAPQTTGEKSVAETEASAQMAVLAGVSGRITTLGFYSDGSRHPGVNAIDVGAAGGTPVFHQVDYIPESIAGGWIWVEQVHEAGLCSQWWPDAPYYNGAKIYVYTYFFDTDGNDAGWHRAAYQHVAPNAPSIDRWWRWNNPYAWRGAWDDPEMTLGDQTNGGLYLGEVFSVTHAITNGARGGLCTDGSHLHQEGDGWRAGARYSGERVSERYNDLHIFVPSSGLPSVGGVPWRPFVAAPPPPEEDRCAALGYWGACDGGVLTWCESGAIKSYDCASASLSCGWQDDSIGYNCL